MSDIYQLHSNTGVDSDVEIQYLRLPVESLVPFPELTELATPRKLSAADQLHPVIVSEIEGSYWIIDGYKRYQAYVSRAKDCLCGILKSSPDKISLGKLRISLNKHRKLTLKEQILFLRWLKGNLTDEQYRLHNELHGITPKDRFEIEQLFSCPDMILEMVERGIIDGTNVPELLLLNTEEQSQMLDIFSKLQFSRSAQRELLEWLPEIAHSRNQSIESIINSPDLTALVKNTMMNPPQKVQKFRDTLFRERFPALAATKDIWTDLVRKTNPDPSRVQFTASDNFEKNRLELKITITTVEEALSIFEQLKKFSDQRWRALLNPSVMIKDGLPE